jgi:hypothetical protein
MSFYADLLFGNQAEQRILDKYDFLEATDGRKSDLRIKGTEILIEKKADSYDMHRYGNIIIERYGSGTKDGGPWSALRNGCRYFLYTFVQNDVTFVFSTVRLVARVKALIKKKQLRLFEKHAGTQITSYYKVAITDLLDLNVGMEQLKHEYNKGQKRANAKNKTAIANRRRKNIAK